MNMVADYFAHKRAERPLGAKWRIEVWATAPSGDDTPLFLFAGHRLSLHDVHARVAALGFSFPEEPSYFDLELEDEA